MGILLVIMEYIHYSLQIILLLRGMDRHICMVLAPTYGLLRILRSPPDVTLQGRFPDFHGSRFIRKVKILGFFTNLNGLKEKSVKRTQVLQKV